MSPALSWNPPTLMEGLFFVRLCRRTNVVKLIEVRQDLLPMEVVLYA